MRLKLQKMRFGRVGVRNSAVISGLLEVIAAVEVAILVEAIVDEAGVGNHG